MLVANAISSTPLCTPYRGMFQTGPYPTHTGIVLNWIESNPNHAGIAHTFREAGYKTGFIGKWHLAVGRCKMAGMHYQGRAQEVEKHIEEYCKKNPGDRVRSPRRARMGYEHWEAYNFHSAFNDYYFYRDAPQRHAKGYETDIIFDQGMKFMKEQQAAGRPFFVMLAPHPPHPPFEKARARPVTSRWRRRRKTSNGAPMSPRAFPGAKRTMLAATTRCARTRTTTSGV